MKILIVIALIAIVASLGAALLYMLRGGPSEEGEPSGKRMAWALTVRIGVSVLVFVCILIAWKLGYIQPHGIPLGA